MSPPLSLKHPTASYPAVRGTCFADDLRRSQLAAAHVDLERIFAETIPGYVGFEFANQDDDRLGTDVWVRRCGLSDLSIDLKIRSVDPIVAFGSDDLLVETFSAVEWGRPGWSVDETKSTDLVYWVFPSGRYVMVPFAGLNLACRRNRAAWLRQYRAVETVTKHRGCYRSQSLVVPTEVVMQAIAEVAAGAGPKPIVLN